MEARRGNLGPQVDPALTTKVVPFNDVEALERALAPGDVAIVLIEPALTNVGIVLPEPGYHDAVRRLTRETGTLLLIDETHTFCAGPGGFTAAYGLEPDMLVIGKAIGGGVPVGTYAMTESVAARVRATVPFEDADVGGIGGTLAGNPLSLAAVRATLGEVLTDEAFARMIPLAERWEEGVNEVIAASGAPWHVTRLGCRAEYHFLPSPPRTGRRAVGGRRHGPGALPAPPRAQPGHPPDALPQHGPHVPGHDRGGRRPSHRGLRGGGGEPLRLR